MSANAEEYDVTPNRVILAHVLAGLGDNANDWWYGFQGFSHVSVWHPDLDADQAAQIICPSEREAQDLMGLSGFLFLEVYSLEEYEAEMRFEYGSCPSPTDMKEPWVLDRGKLPELMDKLQHTCTCWICE